MAIEFYNVKKRKKVTINESEIKKVEYKRETTKGTQVRYAFRAQDDDGTNLTKFVSKADYDKVDAPVAA
ncbi:MAG: hypothetical protein ACON35_06600 [Candidatus Marinamargulisbacteria bacterium]